MIERLDDPAFAERLARWALAVAVATYVALALWLTRGATFVADEVRLFGESNGLAPGEIFRPVGGHLSAVSRFLYESSLRVFGPEHLPLQLAVIVAVAAAAVFCFLLFATLGRPARRPRPCRRPALPRIGAVEPAGRRDDVGAFDHLRHRRVLGLRPSHAGRRRRRLPDAPARRSLAGGGIAFALGIAAWTLAERRGLGRLWVAVVPLVAYAAWWLWALKFDEGIATVSNLLLAPAYAAQALAAAAAALAGLGIDFHQINSLELIDTGWGRLLAVGVLLLAALGVRRRGAAPAFWGAATLLVALFLAGALAFGPLRFPDSARYAYPAAVALVLVLAGAHHGWRPSARGAAVLLGIAALALPTNLWLLRERGKKIRGDSAPTAARLAIIELDRAVAPADFRVPLAVPVDAGDYLASADRFGGLGFDPAELERQGPAIRGVADETLGDLVSPRIAPTPAGTPCAKGGAEGDAVELPSGGRCCGRRPAGPSCCAASPTSRRSRPEPWRPACPVCWSSRWTPRIDPGWRRSRAAARSRSAPASGIRPTAERPVVLRRPRGRRPEARRRPTAA